MESKTLLTCGTLLLDQELSIAFAESATAGRLAAEFSLLPEAGKFLKGGLVCYDASLKEQLLNVPQGLIKTFSPESMEVTMAIALGLEKLIPADLHIGVTGLTAPGGSETAEKPVGTMFIHCRLFGKTLFSEKLRFEGSPEEIVRQTTEHTAYMLVAALKHSNASLKC
ncbi:CinA family protein [Pedobacter sp. V48]|uniref:CinA family protein n=1 Tax=Pedobacter sp. V48 TaxID=509635 RepID=UPI0003E567DD|nr:nicotinamide-nucleotide amidohydrolase family protein [Pedobacter sp. V48]ETZ23057.1 hypothetical protein N824_20690 [Pedobacter sp. V48]